MFVSKEKADKKKIDELLATMWQLSHIISPTNGILVKERIVSQVAEAIKSMYRINVVDADWDCPTYIGQLEEYTTTLKYENCFVISYDNIRAMYDNAFNYATAEKFVIGIKAQLEILSNALASDNDLCKVTFFEG